MSTHHKALPWWLRWQRICLQCKGPKFDPWVGKVPWRMVIYSSILAWRIPCKEEPGVLYSMGLLSRLSD